MGHFSALQKPPPRQTSPPRAHAQDECSQFFCSGIWGSLCSGTAFFSMEQWKVTPCLCHSHFCVCVFVFFPPVPSGFPLPLCPSAPRTVSSRGKEKPGVNGNQPRRPLAVSPPRRTGRRQELSVPLSCVPWGWDLTEIPSSPLPQPATQCPLLQPKEQTQHQEISEQEQGWEEDCMCSSPGEQTGVRPAHDNRINH